MWAVVWALTKGFRILLCKVWSLTQQHLHYLGAC